MHIRPFHAVYPDQDYITSSDSFFKGIKENYPEYRRSGVYRSFNEKGFYAYRIKYADHAFVGLIAVADLEDYLSGNIKKHEHTLADKEQIHLNLLLRNRAIVKPVLLTHRPVAHLTQLLHDWVESHQPEFSIYFESDHQEHSFFPITDQDLISRLSRIFAEDVRESYIADGHHRSSSLKLLFERLHGREEGQNFSGLLCAFFPADEVEILDFNRIVDIFVEMSPTLFMAKLSQVMEIEFSEQPIKPSQPHEMSMYLHREWYLLRWKQVVLDRHKHRSVILDTYLFNDEILAHILNVQDVRTDDRIHYAPGVYGLDAFRHQVNQSEARVGFCLYPISLEDMMTISDEGSVLPPKSTWFQPRMKNGIIVHEF